MVTAPIMFQSEPSRGSTRSPFSGAKRYLHVLYVDHHSGLRDVARLSFRRLGHKLECVGDSIIALEKFASSPAYDLVIADHDLPNLNGLEFVRRLRSKGYIGKIIVICAGLSGEEETAYYQLGVDRVMFKPVVPSGLRKCVFDLFPGSGRVD